MNPYISIWFNTKKTIDEKLKSDWIYDHGLIPYLLYGLNSSIEIYSDLLFLDVNTILIIIIAIAIGFISALFTRAIGLNALFYFGKIWKGKASKREIDTVLSLSFIPNIIVSSYLVIAVIVSRGDAIGLSANNIIVLVAYFFSMRILILGLARVQKFSYGLAILSIFLPQLLLLIIYLVVKGL